MSNAASLRFECNACKKTYNFKPELANKKVKCKCGAVIAVPDLSAQVEEEMYDIADDPKPVAKSPKPAIPVAKPAVAGRAAPVAGSRAGAPPMLGYKSGPTARERDRTANAIIDMTRDCYVPTALIAGSFVVLMGGVLSGMIRGGSPTAVSVSFTILSLVNAALMIGGALFIGGKVGISFGGVWTAILKFIAIAMFVGMVTTIIDAKFGLLGMFVFSLATAAVLYTILFIYLFSMDAEDSIWMVCFFIGLRTALSWLLLPILLGFFDGGGAFSAASRTTYSSAQMKLIDRVEEMKDLGLLEEAVTYIKGGRQSYWLDGVNAAYAAGAKYVAFAVDRDINGRGTPYSIIIEMPTDPQKRAAIVKSINDFRTATHNQELGTPPALTDSGGQYLEIGI